MDLSTRARTLFRSSPVMRLHRAVLQTPPRSSIPSRLLFHNSCPPLTPSESTLPQLLIPLHFMSFIGNTYKKPGGGIRLRTAKFRNSSLSTPRPAARAPAPATPILSMVYFTILWIPRGWGTSGGTAHPGCLSRLSHGSRVTDHRPRLLWSPSTVAPQPAKCQNHGCYCFAAPRETSPLLPVSNTEERTLGTAML